MTASSCNDLVNLKWRKSGGPDFTRYRIYSKAPYGAFTKTDSTMNGLSDTSLTIHGLPRGETWYFRVTAVNYDGAESNYSEQPMVTVKTGVIPKIKAKWNDVLICYNIGDSILKYQWYNSGTPIIGETRQFYRTGKRGGIYNIETIDTDGCINSSSQIEIQEPVTKSLVVYPNPVSVSFSLKIDDETEGRAVISIFNAYGTRVTDIQSEKTGRQFVKEISVANLPDGVYQVKVTINKNYIYNTQIVVAKR
jgi:hypothetical protein